MLRILVIVFFWLCAIGLLTLSIWAEVNTYREEPKRLWADAKTHTHGSITR